MHCLWYEEEEAKHGDCEQVNLQIEKAKGKNYFRLEEFNDRNSIQIRERKYIQCLKTADTGSLHLSLS